MSIPTLITPGGEMRVALGLMGWAGQSWAGLGRQGKAGLCRAGQGWAGQGLFPPGA